MDHIKEFVKILKLQWPFFLFGMSLVVLLTLLLNVLKSPLMLQPGFILGGAVAIITISGTAWYLLSHGYKFVGFKVWEKA